MERVRYPQPARSVSATRMRGVDQKLIVRLSYVVSPRSPTTFIEASSDAGMAGLGAKTSGADELLPLRSRFRISAPIPRKMSGRMKQSGRSRAHVREECPHTLIEARQEMDVSFANTVDDESWLAASRAHGLTKREAEVLLCACDEESEAAIAERLQIAPGTVHAHKTHIFAKLQTRTLVRSVCLVMATRERMRRLGPPTA